MARLLEIRRYSITPQSARCGPFLGCARDSIRPTLLPFAGTSRIQPSIVHWTILLAEIVPVPRAYLGGFPDSISLATSPARFRPDRELHLISNFCLFSHQSHDFWFPKSVDQADGGNRTKRKLKYPLKD